MMFVGVSNALWLLILASIYVLPALGFGRFVALSFLLFPTVILFAAFPLVSAQCKASDAPVPYARSFKLAALSLIVLLPLSIVFESLNANALVQLADASLPEGTRNYVIVSYRSLALTVFGALIGLGFVFPAQVKLQLKKQRRL